MFLGEVGGGKSRLPPATFESPAFDIFMILPPWFVARG
jgi:hypothetical protein